MKPTVLYMIGAGLIGAGAICILESGRQTGILEEKQRVIDPFLTDIPEAEKTVS